MQREELLPLLECYGVRQFGTFREIDSSKPGDYRLNIIIDRDYVLRINDPVITEERLAAVDRLARRYRETGILAPRLLQNREGAYLSPCGGRVCYLSEYLDYPTLDEVRDTLDTVQQEAIRRDVLSSVGRFARIFSDVDLQPVHSMWSIFDLAPLDVDMDERQENLNDLVQALREAGAEDAARQVICFNEANRAKIEPVFRRLPRCVIQGDLNDSNLLIADGRFVGLIDFNMAGTEVNINCFCCETNSGITEEDFEKHTAAELFAEMRRLDGEALQIILEQYELNEDERSVIGNFRNLSMISQFPNVCQFRRAIKKDLGKAVGLIDLIIGQEV